MVKPPTTAIALAAVLLAVASAHGVVPGSESSVSKPFPQVRPTPPSLPPSTLPEVPDATESAASETTPAPTSCFDFQGTLDFEATGFDILVSSSDEYIDTCEYECECYDILVSGPESNAVLEQQHNSTNSYYCIPGQRDDNADPGYFYSYPNLNDW
ncbi:hypothetical protein P43SY_005853 [Pythium insidiosum]|uniref:Uncharacterized protein n=1 Tax=Pythium insidiosum TaxID=114742 RepID=A0AAD5QD61_PYTIN|nr:hypothetical protein P43SY_005853 [Pythium insidiosum]